MMTTIPRVSLCMIVRNEAANLSGALDSVASVVDEIVIADTGSTDGSLVIARERAHRFIQVPWRDDFSLARNAALELASGDWILILDADERLRPGSDKALHQAISTSDLLACRLHLYNHLDDNKTNDDYILRLFRRLPQLRYTGRIHEQIVPSVARLQAEQSTWRCINLPDAVIDHFGYRREERKKQDKPARNIHLLELELTESPDDPYLCYKLYHELGPDEKGSRYLLRAADLVMAMPRNEFSRLAYAAELLTAAIFHSLESEAFDSALRIASFAAENFPDHPATRIALGLAMLRSDMPAAARVEIECALTLEAPPGSFYYDREDWLVTARIALSEALRQEGKYEQALSLLIDKMPLYAKEERLVTALMETYLTANCPMEALREGVCWLRANPTSKVLMLCADAAEMLGDKESADNWRRKAAVSMR